MSFEQELRDASDSMLRALDQIRDLEEQKRTELPGTPRFVELARQVETLALEILRRTEQQDNLARESESLLEAGEVVSRPIDDIPAQAPDLPAPTALRELPAILEDWREAERRLIDSVPGSEGAHLAAGDVRRLRDEYARAHAERQKDPAARF